MRVRWFSLLVLIASLLVGFSVQAAPAEQATQTPLRGRTRPIRISGRAPNRESAVNNPGALTGCNTSSRDDVIYDRIGDGAISADGFPAESWVLSIVSSRDNFDDHIAFWVMSDRNGFVAFYSDDILSAGADPRYTILVGSGGEIEGQCLGTVFDTYGFRPTGLYNDYYSSYPPGSEGVDIAADASSDTLGDVLIPETADGPSPFGDAPSSSVVGGYQDVFYMGDGVVYAIDSNGDLWWYRHDGWLNGEALSWAQIDGSQRVRVGEGWGSFRQVFPAGDGVIYAIQPNGDLLWYRNDCWYEGGACWSGPGVLVGTSWDQFINVFAGDQGVIYAIDANGDLWWYRNDGWQTGEQLWAQVDGNAWVKVGEGWAGFRNVFPAGDGVIYAIQPNGDLLWYRNDCMYDGGACWQGPGIRLGTSWDQFRDVFAGDEGVIYGISPNGDMWWYRNDGWQTGEELWAVVGDNAWVQVGNGW